MKAVVAAFNQEKALVGAFSVLTNLRMELFQALIITGILLIFSLPHNNYKSQLSRPYQLCSNYAFMLNNPINERTSA